VDRTLRALASPKRWALRNGAEVEVETPGTSRAAQLMELYRRLAAAAPGSDERLDALLQVGGGGGGGGGWGKGRRVGAGCAALAVLSGGPRAHRAAAPPQIKWTVKAHDCGLTRELVELIDREADLLNRRAARAGPAQSTCARGPPRPPARGPGCLPACLTLPTLRNHRRGRSPAVMEGLRRRISGLFLSFVEDPAFNSEAARLKVAGPGRAQQFHYSEAGRGTARAAQTISQLKACI
jgi:hypothetical protein